MSDATKEYVQHHFYVPSLEFWIPTAIFFGVGIIGSILCVLCKRNGTGSTVAVSILGSCVSFWLLWFCAFAMQTNPLIQPELTVEHSKEAHA